MKTCCNCNISKEDSEFYKDSHSKDGLTSKCKECQKEYQRKRYQENRDEIYDYTPVEPRNHTCEQCGEDFKSKHNPKYCSAKCRDSNKYLNREKYKITCIGCGKDAEVYQEDGKYCSDKCFQKHTDYSHIKEYTVEKNCSTCGDRYETGCANSKYCSDKCNPVNWERCPVSFNNCIYCNDLFTSQYSNTGYCSTECRWKAVRDRCHPLKEKKLNCKECGSEFVHKYRYGVGRKAYCSNRCLNRVGKRNRKYRKRNNGLHEDVNRTRVFERDKWKCQDCGTKTPRELMGKGLDNSPTLDHIVPLSLGGPHTYGNVQLLCRSCNSIKSNNYEGQTVLL